MFHIPPDLVVGSFSRSLISSRGEDLEIAPPGACRNFASFAFPPTVAGMLSAPLVGDQVVQLGQPNKKRLLAPPGMLGPLHREQVPVDGVMRLIESSPGSRHPRVCEPRRPARLLGLEPLSSALTVGRASRVRDGVRQVTSSLPQGNHPQALALSHPVQQGVQLGA